MSLPPAYLILWIIDDDVNDKDSLKSCQLHRIAYPLLTFAEYIPSITKYQQQILKYPIVGPASSIFWTGHSNEIE